MKHSTVHAVKQQKRKYLPIKILIRFLCNFVAFATIVISLGLHGMIYCYQIYLEKVLSSFV